MARYSVTIRYGGPGYRYHTYEVEAEDLAAAMVAAEEEVPPEVRVSGDLVEIRTAPDPELRNLSGP